MPCAQRNAKGGQETVRSHSYNHSVKQDSPLLLLKAQGLQQRARHCLPGAAPTPSSLVLTGTAEDEGLSSVWLLYSWL